jgi:hypothetical protein
MRHSMEDNTNELEYLGDSVIALTVSLLSRLQGPEACFFDGLRGNWSEGTLPGALVEMD